MEKGIAAAGGERTRYYVFTQGNVAGPYAPEELRSGAALPPEAMLCSEFEYEGGVLNWRRAGDIPELRRCVAPPPAAGPAVAPPRRLSILSSDDDANIRALLWHILSDAGHTVEFARDGDEVFKRLSARNYDLVILDVNMPKLNGYKVSELLHDKLQNPPKILLFTGRDLEREKLQFVCSGADAVLGKGVDNEELLRTIDGLFCGRADAPGGGGNSAQAFQEQPNSMLSSPASITEVIQEKTPDYPGGFVPQPLAAPPAAGAGSGETGKASLEQTAPLSAGIAELRRMLISVSMDCSKLEAIFEKHSACGLADNRRLYHAQILYWEKARRQLTLMSLLTLTALIYALLPVR